MKNLKHIFVAVVAAILITACSPAEGNYTGSEYMPDMAHSVAYEANIYNYYHHNTWDSASTFKLKELSNPRLPVKGTIQENLHYFRLKDIWLFFSSSAEE